jgi:6-phosphogluconolactonase
MLPLPLVLAVTGFATPPQVATGQTQPRAPSSIRMQEYRTMAGIVQVEPDEESVGRALCEMLKLEAAIGVAATGKFTFAISGGSMLGMLSQLADDDSVEWSKCVMGFVSHRCVPNDDDGATFHKARPKFLQSWMDRGLTVLTLGGSTDAEAEAAAYEAALDEHVQRDADGYPSFDLCLIGVGLDGHVGSIYPNIPDVESTRRVVPITGKDGMGKISTKLSLSIRSMQASKLAVVACAGTSAKAPLGKAQAMVRALEAPEETPMSFPASALRSKATWLLDEASAALLSQD